VPCARQGACARSGPRDVPDLRPDADVRSELHQPNRGLGHAAAEQSSLVQRRPALSGIQRGGSM
jgi:hypothetical protein